MAYGVDYSLILRKIPKMSMICQQCSFIAEALGASIPFSLNISKEVDSLLINHNICEHSFSLSFIKFILSVLPYFEKKCYAELPGLIFKYFLIKSIIS